MLRLRTTLGAVVREAVRHADRFVILGENKEPLRKVVSPDERIGADVVDVARLSWKRRRTEFRHQNRVGRSVFDCIKTKRFSLAEESRDVLLVGRTLRKTVAGAGGAVHRIVFLGVRVGVIGGRTLEDAGATFRNRLVIIRPGRTCILASRAVDTRRHPVMIAPRGLGEIDQVVEGGSFDLRKDERGPTPHAVVVGAAVAAVRSVRGDVEVDASRRKRLVRVVIRLHRQREVLHVAGALHTSSGLARSLNSRKKQTDKNTDDGDDDEELDKSEALATKI